MVRRMISREYLCFFLAFELPELTKYSFDAIVHLIFVIYQRYCDFEVALAKMSKMTPILYTNIFEYFDNEIIFQKIAK